MTIYTRGNLSNPKCSHPALGHAGSVSSALPAWLAPQLRVPGPPCQLLAFGFGVLGHQNVPVFHMVTRQLPAQRIPWTFANSKYQVHEVFAIYLLSQKFSPMHGVFLPGFLLWKQRSATLSCFNWQRLKPQGSSFQMWKYDEKRRPLFWFCFALQLRSVKMLGFSPSGILTQKIQLNQQLSWLVSACEVLSAPASPLMTHERNRCSVV